MIETTAAERRLARLALARRTTRAGVTSIATPPEIVGRATLRQAVTVVTVMRTMVIARRSAWMRGGTCIRGENARERVEVARGRARFSARDSLGRTRKCPSDIATPQVNRR